MGKNKCWQTSCQSLELSLLQMSERGLQRCCQEHIGDIVHNAGDEAADRRHRVGHERQSHSSFSSLSDALELKASWLSVTAPRLKATRDSRWTVSQTQAFSGRRCWSDDLMTRSCGWWSLARELRVLKIKYRAVTLRSGPPSVQRSMRKIKCAQSFGWNLPHGGRNVTALHNKSRAVICSAIYEV